MQRFIHSPLTGIAALLMFCCSQSYAATPAVQVGSDFRKMGELECGLKALEAMGNQQNFIHAEINGPDAWGYDERSAVMVHAVPINGGVDIFVVAFSTDAREAERLRNAIREYVFNGSLGASRLPIENRPKVYQATDASRRHGALSMQWDNFNKVATEPVFQSCASGAMAHNGLRETANGNQVIFGVSGTTAAVALGVGMSRGTQVIVISASEDTMEAKRLRDQVHTSIAGCSSL